MSRSKLELTTTSYAVLGLLCVQPWSAYELTRQMTRSLRFMWPRAESGIYREPQKLVDLGYAAVTEVPAGPRRTKPLYCATTAGRRALRRWLAAPSAPPQFESEAMVKFFFADQGTLDDAHLALDELSAHAEKITAAFRAITASYSGRPGPFPERVHIGSLTGRFVFDYASALSAWATWARAHVDEWPDTGAAAAALGDKVQHENERLAGVDS
jgi:DNA-binding PadR family transcriptional regulator